MHGGPAGKASVPRRIPVPEAVSQSSGSGNCKGQENFLFRRLLGAGSVPRNFPVPAWTSGCNAMILRKFHVSGL